MVRTDKGAERDFNGVRATLHSNATSLTAYLSVLGNVRTVRDFGYGLCLENAEEIPELRNGPSSSSRSTTWSVIRREQIGGDYAMEFLIKGAEGTTVSLREEQVEPREACAATAGEPRRSWSRSPARAASSSRSSRWPTTTAHAN